MNQLSEIKNGMQFLTKSEISAKIQRDIACLRANLEVITEEYEIKLIEDLERFLLEDVAKEIRVSIYDPVQNNRVYLEYCYKVEPLSSFSSRETQDKQVELWSFPDTCLFDIFIYFTRRFAALDPDVQRELLNAYNIDWYDLNFSLKYSKKDKRKKAGVIYSDDLSINRYIYESPVDDEPEIELDGPHRTAEINETPVRTKRGIGQDKLNDFEKKILEAIKSGRKINFVTYRDMDSAVSSIMRVLLEYNRVPIRWSLSRGFTIEKSANEYVAGKANFARDATNPPSALKFVLGNVEDRASYIFEDFHHHLGGASSVNTAVAEIRSLVRDLSRDLKNREEFVFFLSPSDTIPVELVPVFNLLKQETGDKSTSYLDRYGYNMTDAALCSKNKPLIGRDNKVKRVIQVLCQMETNNPILVGEPGVGKTALVEGLASEIVKGNVPSMLKGKTLFSLNLNSLVAGAKYRGDFEERITKLIDEVKANYRDIIIFIDEIHTILGAGSAEGAAGAEDILKPTLARGEFPCIGATTYEGYEILQTDPALARRFQKLDIAPATIPEAEKVLYGIKHVFEKHHGVRISDEAIEFAVKLGEKHIKGQFLPGKAVRLLDSTSAYVKLEGRRTVSANDIEEEIQRSIH